MTTAILDSPATTPASTPSDPVAAATKVGVNTLPEPTNATTETKPAAEVKVDTTPKADAVPAAKTEPAKAEPAKTEAKPDAKAETPKQLSLLDGDEVPATTEKPKDTPPAEVTYSLKAPEKSPLSEADIKSIADYAKERKLTPEAAQALVDRESATVLSVRANVQEKAKQDIEALRATFAAQTRADAEIGGAKLKETVALANRALAMPGAEEFAAMLKASPWVNDRRTLKFLAAVGRLTAEDIPASGATATTQATRSPVDRWYGPTK